MPGVNAGRRELLLATPLGVACRRGTLAWPKDCEDIASDPIACLIFLAFLLWLTFFVFNPYNSRRCVS